MIGIALFPYPSSVHAPLVAFLPSGASLRLDFPFLATRVTGIPIEDGRAECVNELL